MTCDVNIINYFECKGVILKTINDVINLHSRCVYHRLSLIIQNNNTERNILEIKKGYHCAEAKERNVFPSPGIVKGAISDIAVTVIMENWRNAGDTDRVQITRDRKVVSAAVPSSPPSPSRLTEPRYLWEILGEVLPRREIDVS